METVPITKDGYEKLKKELERLLNVERPSNVKAIEEARAHGDLSENADTTRPRNGRGSLKAVFRNCKFNWGSVR